MVTKLVLAAAAASAACFGSGPMPQGASGAEVVFTVPAANGCNGTFVADVGIGRNFGVAMTTGYEPWNNCNGGGVSTPYTVYQFGLSGGTATQLGMVGTSSFGQDGAHVAAAGSDSAWAATDPSSQNVDIAPAGITIQTTNMGGGPNPVPTGIVLDDSTQPATAYLGMWSPQNSPIAMMYPYFPCCNGGNSGGVGSNYALYKVALTGGGAVTKLPVSPRFYCEDASSCLAGNTTSLYYVQHADPQHVATIDAFPKSGTMASQETTLGTIENTSPVAIAADDAHVAWASTVNFAQLSTEQNGAMLPQPACTIAEVAVGSPMGATTMLMTSAFSCTAVAIDGDSAYFTIAGLTDTGHGVVANGAGIGRVHFADMSIETLALGLTEFAAGPRSLALDADSIYLLDPLAVAKIPKTALDGRNDIAH